MTGNIPPTPWMLYCACGCEFDGEDDEKCPDCGREGCASESEAAAEAEDIRNRE